MAKYFASPTYTFTPSTGTIDFSLMGSAFNARNLAAIINISTGNTQIYLIGIPGYGATIDATGRVFTLQQSTATMNASDLLVFVMDDGNDNLSDLLTIAAGVQDPDATYRLPQGIQVRNPVLEDLVRRNNALLFTLINVVAAAYGVSSGDVDSMLNEPSVSYQ